MSGRVRSRRGDVNVDDHAEPRPVDLAVGDVTTDPLTPVAIREVSLRTAYGNHPDGDYANVPNAVFSHPPIAAVG